MAKHASEQLRVSFTVSGEELARLNEFVVENGYPSAHFAARALLFGAMAIYPSWGISRAIVEALINEVRTRLFTDAHTMLAASQVRIQEELNMMMPTGESNREDQA